MVKIVSCPCCKGGQLKIDMPSNYKIITDGYFRKLPFKKKCNSCNRDIRYMVVHSKDYDSMLEWVHQK